MEWISVKDHLPLEGINVISYDGESIRQAIIMKSEITFEPRWSKFYLEHENISEPWREPTHWIPMPNLPNDLGHK